MPDDFCITHGYAHMKSDKGPVPYCARCDDPSADEREAIESLIDDIREYTNSRSYAGGFSFDMNMDQAVERVRKFITEREQSHAR